MKVMVVGTGGEIGYYVYEFLKRKGYEVVPVVRTSNGPLLSRYAAKPIVFDTGHISHVEEGLLGCDALVNCMIYRQSADSSSETVRKNISFSKKLLQSARRAKVKRVVHLSSIVVLRPRITDVDLLAGHQYSNEKDWYTQSKIATEKIFLGGGDNTTSTAVIRPGIVYGANMNWSRTAFQRTKDHVVILPKVDNYCYAVHPLDIARLIERLVQDNRSDAPRLFYGINPETISWADFYSFHASALGMQDRVSLIPTEELESRLRRKEDSLVQNVMDWMFETSFLEGPKRRFMKEGWRFIMNKYGDALKTRSSLHGDSLAPSRLLPTGFELELYQTNGDISKVETGNGLQFQYRLSLADGCKNAALWKANSYT